MSGLPEGMALLAWLAWVAGAALGAGSLVWIWNCGDPARPDRLPLAFAIALTLFVLNLPTDPGMYEPAKEAFPIVLGQGWRLMGAGIIAYGVSVTLNIWIFDRLRGAVGKFAGLRGFIAAALSQIVDTLIFITVSFYGVRPIMDLMIGQALAKVVLSAVMVPVIIALVVRIGRKLDA